MMTSDQRSIDFSDPSDRFEDNTDGVSISIEEDDDDDESSQTNSSSHNNSSSTHVKPGAARRDSVDRNAEEIRRLAARETQTIRCWRLLVLMLILALGAGVAYGSWVFLNSQEEYHYKEGVSLKISDVRERGGKGRAAKIL